MLQQKATAPASPPVMDGREQLTIILVVLPTYLYIGVFYILSSPCVSPTSMHTGTQYPPNNSAMSVLHKLVTSGNSNSCVRVSSVVGAEEEVWVCGA